MKYRQSMLYLAKMRIIPIIFLCLGFSCSLQKPTSPPRSIHNPKGIIDLHSGANNKLGTPSFRSISSLTRPLIQKALPNDLASEYRLKQDNLYRIINGQSCLISNGIHSFEVSRRKEDSASIYFVRKNDLYILKKEKKGNTPVSSCPASQIIKILPDVDRYNSINHKKTLVTALALTSSSYNLLIWDNQRPITKILSIDDYMINPCFAEKGSRKSKYIAFAIDFHGNVYKILDRGDYDLGKTQYASLRQFRTNSKLCSKLPTKK